MREHPWPQHSRLPWLFVSMDPVRAVHEFPERAQHVATYWRQCMAQALLEYDPETVVVPTTLPVHAAALVQLFEQVLRSMVPMVSPPNPSPKSRRFEPDGELSLL